MKILRKWKLLAKEHGKEKKKKICYKKLLSRFNHIFLGWSLETEKVAETPWGGGDVRASPGCLIWGTVMRERQRVNILP